MCECEYGLIEGRGSKGVGVVCSCDGHETNLTLAEYVDSHAATWLAEIESANALDLSEEEDLDMPPSMYVDKDGNDVPAEEVEAMDFATRVERGLTTITRPSESPTLKRQQEEMREADRERAAYADKVRVQARAELDKEADEAKWRRDVEREKAKLTSRERTEPTRCTTRRATA
jgi:hypothetical protein